MGSCSSAPGQAPVTPPPPPSAAAQGASKLNMSPVKPAPAPGLPRQVVYMPSCVTRMMGPAAGDSETASVHEKLLSLFEKAGYEVIYPEVCVETQSLQ